MFAINLWKHDRAILNKFFEKYRIETSDFQESDFMEFDYFVEKNNHRIYFKNASFDEFDNYGICLHDTEFVYFLENRDPWNNIYRYDWLDDYCYSYHHECFIWADDAVWVETEQDHFFADSDEIERCAYCDEFHFRANLGMDDNNCLYCDNCFHLACFEHGRNGRIHDYHYSPDLIFYQINKSKLFFGIEVEIECLDDYESRALDILEKKEFFFKEDGSIDGGFEIVTHPMQYEYIYQNSVFSNFEKLRKEADGVRGHNAGGIHIHLSRDGFLDKEHLRKFIFFLNKKDNREFVVKISQRKIDKLWRWADFENNKTYAKMDNFWDENISRYRAVNLTNRKTIEIRIFNSNLREARILKNIEFVKSLFEFTKKCKNSNLKEYLKYLRKNSEKYTNLYNFCVEKNLI